MTITKQRHEITFADPGRFSKYCKTVDGTFCPFIGPAVDERLMYATEYTLTGESLACLQEEALLLGLYHTELFRSVRNSLPSPRHKTLVCENLIFSLPNPHDLNGREFLSQPHWCLKSLYTKAGILFGKFWKGEEEVARNGLPIPTPPVHFLSIRSAVRRLDRRFFSKAFGLLPEFDAADDSGQRILPPEFSIPRSAAEASAFVGTGVYSQLLTSTMECGDQLRGTN